MWGRIYPHATLLILANIILKASCKGSGSLTYVIDNTYSMSDDIAHVRRSVDDISDIVFNDKSSQIDNMVLITFNDPDAKVRAVTKERNTFKTKLDAVKVQGGGDCWEPSMKGLLLALEKSNRDSYVYVFTDAPAKDYRDSHYVKKMCQTKQSRIVFVLTGRCGNRYNAEAFDVYFDIAHACTGQAIVLPKNDLKMVLPTIGEMIKGNQTVLTTTIIPAGVRKDIPFTIDDHTDCAIVSVSGINVNLRIVGPDSEKIMWHNNGKVLKLSNVKPGTYVATVKGESRTSAVIVGRTDIFFSHGFSELKPKSLGDTSLQPIAESNVHLSISVTDEHRSAQIESAQILDMNEKPINGPMPLTEISKNFYVTNLFVAPTQRFKVAVNGIIKATRYPIIRIGKIPVTPIENTRPKVEIAEGKAIEIEYNSTVKLTCKVIAFPKPKIEWSNIEGHVMPSQMALVEEPYKYISYMDILYASKGDRYKCYATNDVGSDETTINVTVKEPFVFKSTPTEITKLTYGTDGTITCDITAHLPMDIHWYYVNETTGQTREILTSDKYELSASRTQLKIKDMDLDLVGNYTCKVSLKNKKSVQKSFQTQVKIDGLVAPKIQGVPKINVTKGKTVDFECKVTGVPPPKISWFFGGKSGSAFTPISFESMLRITNVDNQHEGEYKCVAKNSLGSDEHVTTLIVEYAPVIVTRSTTVEAIEGDLALRIPCVSVGVPKPVMSWKLKGITITPDAKYTLEDDALVIMKPTKKDTSSYTCEAKNHVSSVSVTFQVKVDKYPKSSGIVHNIYLKEGETRKLECEAYDSKSQKIKWFKTKEIPNLRSTTSRPEHGTVTTPAPSTITSTIIITQDAGNTEHIQITSASPSDHDGNYTCHVSDKHGNTQTHTYVVDVGNAPKFMDEDDATLSNWRGDITDIIQYCDIYDKAKPMPVVQWRFNGEVLPNLSSAGVGHYTCNISNVHGSVLKRFDVKSSACLITRNLRDTSHMPLVLNDERSWHKFENTNYYTIVEQEVKIILSCPSRKETSNTFKTFPKKSTLEAICYNEDSFLVEDKIYKLSDLECTNSIEPSINKKKVKCSTETSELMSVGYNVPSFLEAYEVCFDHKSNMPLYTRILMTETNNNGASGGYNWYTYPGIDSEKTERGFTCKDASSSCCYSKSQLVNAIDFNDGPAKKSTFIDPLNVIPVWRPCNTSKSPWEEINDMVRSKFSIYTDFVVWSGTHTMQEKNGAFIPRYLWKVVRLDDDEEMAIVYVNDPNPTKSDIKCKTPNNLEIEDIQKIYRIASTYCCSLADFLKSFNFHVTDIGESMKAALDKMKNKS